MLDCLCDVQREREFTNDPTLGWMAMTKLPEGTFDDDGVRKLLRAAVNKAGSQKAFAKQSGLDRAQVNGVLHGRRPVSESIIEALRLRVVYVPK